MASPSSHDIKIALYTIGDMIEGASMVNQWNAETESIDDFTCSPMGMQRLAASCMLIESIGEGVKNGQK